MTKACRLATRRRVRLAILAAGIGAVSLAAMVWAESSHLGLASAAGLLIAAGGYLALIGDRLVADLEATRGAVLAAGADGVLPPLRSDSRPLAEVGELRDAISRRLSEVAADTDRRHLAQVIAALPDAVILATPEGLVSAANHRGLRIFGGDGTLVGTSLFGHLSRQSLSEAVERAEGIGLPVDVQLATIDGGTLPSVVVSLGIALGYVLVVRSEGIATDHRAEIELDLALHETPPAASAPLAATALVDLPALVLDTETTGMDPGPDRIVAIGTVRLHGRRLFRRRTLDLLVRPGRPIPSSASAVHRITDAMVSDAPEIDMVWPRISEVLKDVAVIGHHIDFDLAMLKAAAVRCGLAWREPLALDTARLVSALDPSEKDLDLAAVARRHGVFATGRHTALGDSLVTAELYLRLVPRLLDRGIVTLGDAIRFGESATALVAAQRATVWGRR